MSQNKQPALEQLQADLIFLMNRYSGEPSELTAHAIATVMHGILKHPLIELFPEFREQCARGLKQWNLRAIPARAQDSEKVTRVPCTIH